MTSASTKTYKCAHKTAANTTQPCIIVTFTATLETVCYTHQTAISDCQTQVFIVSQAAHKFAEWPWIRSKVEIGRLWFNASGKLGRLYQQVDSFFAEAASWHHKLSSPWFVGTQTSAEREVHVLHSICTKIYPVCVLLLKLAVVFLHDYLAMICTLPNSQVGITTKLCIAFQLCKVEIHLATFSQCFFSPFVCIIQVLIQLKAAASLSSCSITRFLDPLNYI